MKYFVMYECRSNGQRFQGGLEVECDFEPSTTDAEILDLVRQDSIRFVLSGTAGIEVLSIKQAS